MDVKISCHACLLTHAGPLLPPHPQVGGEQQEREVGREVLLLLLRVKNSTFGRYGSCESVHLLAPITLGCMCVPLCMHVTVCV